MDMFNFSLTPNGILFLCSSETTGEMMEYFDPLHHKWKIYRCKGKRRSPDDPILATPNLTYEKERFKAPVFGRTEYHRHRDEAQLLDRLLSALAGDYLPLTLVVNDHMEVVHIVGDTEGLLRLPTGKVSHNIQKLAVKELSIPIATGIQKVFKTREKISYTKIHIRHGKDTSQVHMTITPMAVKKNQTPLAAVLIERVKNGGKGISTEELHAFDLDQETQQRIVDLEAELQFTRENLQATIEELETSNEELQATNEELLASNEELQSTNGELQSVNEELFTVNAEYQSKIVELTELNNDMDNLLASTQIATLFLDEKLDIRKFTPGVDRIYKILETDVDRPLSHLSHSLADVEPLEVIRSR
jgi:two-component system CheB/CheR fusion protein